MVLSKLGHQSIASVVSAATAAATAAATIMLRWQNVVSVKLALL